MELSLFHFVLLLVIPTIVFISLIMFRGVSRFVKIFDGKKNVVEGSKLVENLEIPGLKSFVRQEIILGLAPYIALILMMVQGKYVEIYISNLGLMLTIFTVLIFITWLIFDIAKSISIHKELTKLAEDTSRLKKITGSALDGLRFVIHSKGIVRRTAMKYTAGVVRGKLETQQKKRKSFFRKVGITGLKAIENITSFPERVTKKLAQWVKEDLDERLVKRFSKYSERSMFNIFVNITWSLVPAIWLVLVYHIV